MHRYTTYVTLSQKCIWVGQFKNGLDQYINCRPMKLQLRSDDTRKMKKVRSGRTTRCFSSLKRKQSYHTRAKIRSSQWSIQQSSSNTSGWLNITSLICKVNSYYFKTIQFYMKRFNKTFRLTFHNKAIYKIVYMTYHCAKT